MKKIGELNTKSMNIIIKYDDKAKANPYRIYRRYWGYNKYGYGTTKEELLQKYSDLYSVTVWVADYVGRHNEESR